MCSPLFSIPLPLQFSACTYRNEQRNGWQSKRKEPNADVNVGVDAGSGSDRRCGDRKTESAKSACFSATPTFNESGSSTLCGKITERTRETEPERRRPATRTTKEPSARAREIADLLPSERPARARRTISVRATKKKTKILAQSSWLPVFGLVYKCVYARESK